MNTYEVTKADGTTVSFAASGYTFDRPRGVIRFYDTENRKVATYSTGEWISLHMRSPLVSVGMPAASPAIRSEEFALYHGH